MAKSSATTVEQYLAELPEERRAVIAQVREVVLRNLPDGYAEALSWGMISYEIPLERFPDTYNRQPLGLAALAAQKNHYALYLTGACADPEQVDRLREEFREAGKKLDMGKSCLRFRGVDDLPLETIGRVIASTPPEQLIARHQADRQR